jgi:aldehyde:ferredoxin oxidoreductase
MSEVIKGYTAKQLRVSLSDNTIKTEPTDPKVIRKYLGGVGYGAYLLYKELIPGIDPLGEKNKLIFATSPLSLYKIPGGGSITVCFKSPATNGWGESRCGGNFGPDLKAAGFDHIIVEGKSDKPVYLVINDGQAELKCAAHLVGKNVSEKTQLLKSSFPEVASSAMCIGIAGEQLVKFASIMSGDRAAGRCGGGAVMGSKNLQAILVTGTNKILPAEPSLFKDNLRNVTQVIKNNPMSTGFKEYGTIGDMPSNDEDGDWPTKNWQSNSWGKGIEIFDQFQENNFITFKRCYKGCPVACGRIVNVDTGKYKTPRHEGAEYESISVFTAYVMNDDPDVAIHCDYLCNEYGLDTISCGAMIAFAMECYEKDILDQEKTGGLELIWGNSGLLPKLIKMISYRDGIGDILADGVRIAAQKLGSGSDEFAIHVKGLEGPAHDPRSGKALGVTYGTGNRGMCHIQPVEGMAYDRGKMDWGLQEYGLTDPEKYDRWDEKGKGKEVKILQDGMVLPDILSTCKFMMYAGVTLNHWASLLTGLTGWDITGKELLKIGERVVNLQRLFNMREGFSRKDDYLPKRVMETPQFGDYHNQPDCTIHDFDALLDEYYNARGWDKKSGEPTISKIEELGLSEDIEQ